jgi:hypothetical protein
MRCNELELKRGKLGFNDLELPEVGDFQHKRL